MSLTFEPIAVPLRVDEDGTVRMATSRVTLDTVLGAYLCGDTPEEIAAGFPSVPVADIHTTIAWYLQHREQVDAYLQQGAEEGEAWRRFWESRYDKPAIRERLLARKAELEAERRAASDRG
jgi:uncharacterized protein (DUF433 family)